MAEDAAQEFGPLAVEPGEDLLQRAIRLKLVLAVERPGRGEIAIELEIRQQGLDDQRPGVVLGRQLTDR